MAGVSPAKHLTTQNYIIILPLVNSSFDNAGARAVTACACSLIYICQYLRCPIISAGVVTSQSPAGAFVRTLRNTLDMPHVVAAHRDHVRLGLT